MRKIILTTLVVIFVLLTACADKPKLSKIEMGSLARNCCKSAVEKYIHHNSVMLSTIKQRGPFHRLNVALRNNHPINISDIRYRILKFNSQEKYWPVQISCKVVIEPSYQYDTAGFKADMEVGIRIYKDDFGKYSAEVMRAEAQG